MGSTTTEEVIDRPPPALFQLPKALDLARTTEEGARDPVVISILEVEINRIWIKIQTEPATYVMSREEFGVFNYFQNRFQVLEVFQVYQPVLIPPGVADETASYNGVEETAINRVDERWPLAAKVVLMEHTFGKQLWHPAIIHHLVASFNKVVMNFTVTSSGRQFDRLALMYFGDSEIWRTSTAEPTTAGIRWEYLKDMTEYLYFWNSPQTLIFDLGNLIDSTYTGYYHTTLTATFFTSPETAEPADLIIPISARHGSEKCFQVLIDGQLAGVQWPFPVVFTGGIVPRALEAKSLDSMLSISMMEKEAVHSLIQLESYWLVTGKIFIWLDSNNSITTGTAPTLSLPTPIITTSQFLTQNASGANETLTYTTNVQRSLSISSTVITENGTTTSTWLQELGAMNYGQYSAFGAIQINNATTHGVDISTSGEFTKYKSEYTYPVWVNTTYLVLSSTNFTLDAAITRGLELSITGAPVFPDGLQPFTYLASSAPLTSGFSGTHLSSNQRGSAHYLGTSAGSSGFGSTSQTFEFSGLNVDSDSVNTELYYRDVEAVNSTIVYDEERLVGAEIGKYANSRLRGAYWSQSTLSPKAAIGRGKGNPKQLLVGGGVV
ncbi:hypothetical protein DID88_000955 [Monilinia fructigena]|uniref:Peptide N-acetyl-beta-D-glucosaminyl asparaginase amidase A N-terminal domain-containing protein n=1 Tax=Monilinia fructigena TaxID=38457 RepID=A0A395IYN2_9HELO|nr:hypothetical protein DID88_000955 [Monilinia fructigena]